MARAQKPVLVFRQNGRVHLNRQWASVQSTTGSRGVHISDSNAGYTMFRGSVKGTGYPLHSPVSPSLPFPCVTVCHHISTGLYLQTDLIGSRWRSSSSGRVTLDAHYRQRCVIFSAVLDMKAMRKFAVLAEFNQIVIFYAMR